MESTGSNTHSLLKRNSHLRDKISKSIVVLEKDKEKVRYPSESPSPHSSPKPESGVVKVDLELAALREQGLQAQINDLTSNLSNVTAALRVKSEQISKLMRDKESLEEGHRADLRGRDAVIEEKSKAIEKLTRKQEHAAEANSDQSLWNEVNDVNKQLRSQLFSLSKENQSLQVNVDALTKNSAKHSESMKQCIDYAVQCKEQVNKLKMGPDSAGVARSALKRAEELERRNEGLNKNLQDAMQVRTQLERLQASAETAATFRASIAQELTAVKTLMVQVEEAAHEKQAEKSKFVSVSKILDSRQAPEVFLPESPEPVVGEKRPLYDQTEPAARPNLPRVGCVYCQQPAHGLMHKCSLCDRIFHSACARSPHRDRCMVCSGDGSNGRG